MKKVIFLFAALMAVFSCIAAVSAYEGHQVDVKAHVENALMVSDYDVDFGIVFPQEALESQFKVGLSQSFRDQERYSTVQYDMYWEPKLIAGHAGVQDPDGDTYFEPIWPFINVMVNDKEYDQADYVFNQNGTILIGSQTLYLEGNECDIIHLVLDPPVFDGWYNVLTDPRKPSGVLSLGKDGIADDQFYTTVETAACGFTAVVPHADLGSNFKIQVTKVVLDVPGAD
jgi:hypothetical protein